MNIKDIIISRFERPQRNELGGVSSQYARDERIDSLKFFLIVLVIVGHVVNDTLFRGDNICNITKTWIYSFHMPLFVFISGYFSRKKDLKSFWFGSLKLFETLLFFQIIALILKVIIHAEFEKASLLIPWYHLWYLLCLIYWRLLLVIMPKKILNHALHVLIITIFLGLFAGFLPFNKILSLQRFFAFMPFFFLGYYMRGKSLYVKSKYFRVFCYFALIFSFFVPIFFAPLLGDLRQMLPYNNSNDLFCRLFMYCLSVPMATVFLNVCPSFKWSAMQGKHTLQYFIYHPFIMVFLFRISQYFNLPTDYLIAICYSIGICLLIYMLLKSRFFINMTNPSLFFIKNNTAKE